MPDSGTTYSVKTNGFSFSFTKEEIDSADIIEVSDASFNIIKDNRSANAKVVATDAPGKRLKVDINGETFDIEIKDELDQTLEQMGFGKSSVKQIKEIKAPMPGLVVEISVIAGQAVKEGDKLLILEAMKMENSIIIHADGIIKNVSVIAGQAVEKGQVLVELE